MNKSDADKIITGYVKKLFGFAVSKVRNYCDAEELAQEIVFQVYRSLLLRDNIINLDGYIYRVSQNVFARYVDGKCRYRAVDGLESMPDENDAFRELEKEESCGILRREITYLSEIQRKIAVHYYFRDLKIREIASRLSLSENTVKWHLACLRKELRTGMEKTRTTGALGAQPITLTNMGHNGHPGEYGDTANFLAKAITQNVAYAAYHQPRTISGIAEELGVNPIFIEDEVAVLEAYGYMDKLSNGKFRTNIHITEPSEESYKIYRAIEKKYPPLLGGALKDSSM